MILRMTSALGDLLAGTLRTVELEIAAEERRAIELTEAERWARDPIGWINHFVHIASKFGGARGRIAPMKMRLFPDQEATIAAWIDLEHLHATGELIFRNVVIEKSRQIGETWLFAAVILWALHYHAVSGLAIHQKGSEIANRGPTIKSLFGRVAYMDKRLDRHLVPGLGRLHFKPFAGGDPASLENLDNGASVTGEARRDDPGRGGSFDFILADEAAFILHGEAVFAAIDEACPNGKALLSTVNGDDNFHARIADDEPEGWGYLRLHWSTHPVYRKGLHVAAIAPTVDQAGKMAIQPTAEMAANAAACVLCKGTIRGVRWNARRPLSHRFPGRLTSPWYEGAVRAKTVEQVASELDIDRERSLTARVYDEFETAIHVHTREIAFVEELPLELGWDYGLDCTAVVICQDAPNEYRLIGEVELVDKPGETPTPENVARRVVAELRDLGIQPRLLTPDWTRRILFNRGDPAGDIRGLDTGKPLTSSYRRLGFEIGKPPTHLTRTVEPSIRAVKMLLLGHPKPLRVSPRCSTFVKHIRHNRWPVDAQGKRQRSATRPLDDEHNHMMRAFAYLVLSKFPPTPPSQTGPANPWDESGDSGARVWGSLLEDAEPLGYDAVG